MKKFIPVTFITVLIFAGLILSDADSSDEDIFSATIPSDALLVLDLSGSMNYTPAGQYMYINSSQSCGSDVAYYLTSATGHTLACSIDPYDNPPMPPFYNAPLPKYSNESCSGPFYINLQTAPVGWITVCTRLAIAKRAIYNLLNDCHSTPETINTDDETSLGIRMGYMRFYNCSGDDTGGDYSSGCSSLIREINSHYNDVYASVDSENASGGTSLDSSLNEAKHSDEIRSFSWLTPDG